MEKYFKLKEISEIIAGMSEDKEQTGNFAYNFIQPNSFSSDGDIVEMYTIFRQEKIPEKYLLKNGDVLVKRLNPNSAVVVDIIDIPTVVSSNLFIVRPRNGVVSEYLACLFEQHGVLSQIEHFSGTLTAIKAISGKKLEEVTIPVVTQEKQEILGALWRLYKRRKRLLRIYLELNDKLLVGIAEQMTKIH